MPLQASNSEPGLWVNSDAPSDGSGVHALIIGISRYDHLAGGNSAAPNTYGLGQLTASALTAYRFFTWMRDAYVLHGWPIARVRLLLSPIRKGYREAADDELADCEPAVCAGAPEATFSNCKRALENWYTDMQALAGTAKGRSLFMFSGHGMERRQSSQVLLPSDYLRPPAFLINDAISTPNIADSLSYLPRVSSHVLLLDACRNDVDQLRGARGSPILNDAQSTPLNPLFEKGVLYATASGLRAYSPKRGGLSLFGQALLDGLRSMPEPPLDEAPIELTIRGPVSTVEINRLGSYMKGRVAALIRAASGDVIQIVRAEVSSSDPGNPIELTEVPRRFGRLGSDASARTRGWSGGHLSPSKPTTTWLDQRYQSGRAAKAPPVGVTRSEQIHAYQRIFKSEYIASSWLDRLRILGLSTGILSDHRDIDLLSSAVAARVAAVSSVQVNVRMKSSDPIGHLMIIEDRSGRPFCCVLPSDIAPAVFQLEIDADRKSFLSFAAFLGPEPETPRGTIAGAWTKLRAHDALSAAAGIEGGIASILEDFFRDGESVLRTKLRSPLAATVGAVLLLKANQFERLHDWARNLANWFPTMPDGVVIWTEQCRRASRGRSLHPELLPWFVRELSARSLPFTSDGFDWASSLVDDISSGRLPTDTSTRVGAQRLAERLAGVAPFFRDTGFFCTYAGFPSNWDALKHLGPIYRARPRQGRDTSGVEEDTILEAE